MTETLRRTPLYPQHLACGAKFVPFAGWEMPIQFQGVLQEVAAVRSDVGIFDVSHMGELRLHGPQARQAIDYLSTNNVRKLAPQEACYSLLCDTNGGIIDDLIVYCEAPDSFFLCVNASRIQADFEHIRSHVTGMQVHLQDVSEAWGMLAIQGPNAPALLQRLLGQNALGTLAPFAWQHVTLQGIDALRVARTGYTGEQGFELFCPSHSMGMLWEALCALQSEIAWQPCGLASRDILRLEMKYPLYGQDIDIHHTPLAAGLGFAVKLDKGDFIGAQSLRQQKELGLPQRWVGFELLERGIARAGYPVFSAADTTHPIGQVTSGNYSPTLNRSIGCAWVPKALAVVGNSIQIGIRDKLVRAHVVKTPFYRRKAP